MKSIIKNGKELSQMTIGTVQLGMNYGIANNLGQPNTAQSHKMLDCCFENGITSLDTARAYGTSEDVLGGYFKERKPENMPFITTKVRMTTKEGASDKEVESEMRNSVETSLEKLGVSQVDCLLIHSPEYMTRHGAIVPKIMEKFVVEGYTKMSGVSIYLPEEVDTMLKYDVYQAIQIPMSLFDQKLIYDGYVDKLKEKDITVFVRSVFLQGLFFMNPDNMGEPDLTTYAAPYIRKLHEFCERTNMSIAEFAISFIRDVPGVTSLVLGCDTDAQVMENIRYMNAPVISPEIRKEALEVFKSVNMEEIMKVLRRPKKQ